MNAYEIEANNGAKLRLMLDERGLRVEHIDSHGELDIAERYSDEGLLSMLDWAYYQRNNRNQS